MNATLMLHASSIMLSFFRSDLRVFWINAIRANLVQIAESMLIHLSIDSVHIVFVKQLICKDEQPQCSVSTGNYINCCLAAMQNTSLSIESLSRAYEISILHSQKNKCPTTSCAITI